MSDNIGIRLTGDASQLQGALQAGGKAVSDFGQKAQRDLKDVGDQADRTGKQALTLQQVMGLFTAREVAQFGWRAMSGELSGFEQAMVSAQTTAQKLKSTLNFAVGKDNAARDMLFLRDTSRELGMEFNSTAQQYARLAASSRGTNMEGRQTRELFESIAQASTVMGLSVEESEGSFRAVQQMMSKGKVQAEELRGQLGERLPGAFQIAARAMGVTTGQLDKMLETGQVMAEDFLPKFAAQLKSELAGSVAEASNTAQAATNRFTNSYNELKQAMADTGFYDAVAARQAALATGFHESAAAMREAKAAGAGFFGQLFAGFAADIGLRNPLTGISASAKDNQHELEEARKRLQELQAQGNVSGSKGFWNSEQEELKSYIARLQQALAAKAALGATVDNTGGEQRRMANLDREKRQDATDTASLASLRLTLSGQNANFQSRLTELYRLYTAGKIESLAEYQAMVKKLIADEGGVKKPESKVNPNDAIFKGLSERTAELRAQAVAQDNLTAAQKAASKILDDLRTGAIKLTTAEKARMGVALQALLVADKEETAREKKIKLDAENAKIIEKNTEAANKANDAHAKAIEGEVQTNEKMREEIAILGLSEASRTRRQQLLEEEAIKRLEIDLVMASNLEGNEREVALLEREIALRKQRIGLIGQKADAENNAKWLEDRVKDADEFGKALTSSLMQGGKSFMDYLVSTMRTTVLTPMLRPIGDMAGNFMSSLMSPNQAAAEGSGNSMLQLGSSLGSMFGAGGIGGSMAAGAGWLTGATTFGGSMAAAGSLMGTGTAAGLMSGMGMVAGALGPLAIGAALIYSLTKGKGGPKTEGGYAPGGMGIGGIDIGGNLQGSQRGDVASAKKISDAMEATYAEFAKTFAVAKKKIEVGVFYSKDNEGDSLTQLQVRSGTYNRSERAGGIENVARGDEALVTEADAEGFRVVISELLTELGGKFKDYFSTIDLGADSETLQAALAAAAASKQLTDAMEQMGQPFKALADLSVEAGASFVEMAGGIQTLSGNLSAYVENFYTADEKREITAQRIADAINSAGGDVDLAKILTMTREDYRAMVEAAASDTSEAGQRLSAALITVSGAFAQISPPLKEAGDALEDVADSAREAAAIASERAGLERQLYQLLGDTNALRAMDLAALNASNRGLQLRIWRLQDEQAAQVEAQRAIQQASESARQSQQQYTQALEEATNFLRGFASSIAAHIEKLDATPAGEGSPETQLTASQAQFRALVARARTGDREAMNRLTQSAEQYANAGRSYFGSSAPGVDIIREIREALEGLPGQISPEQLVVNAVNTGVGLIISSGQSGVTTLAQTITHLEQSVVNRLSTDFATLDTTLDGQLNLEEFLAGMREFGTQDDMAELFRQLDLNHDGQLSELEAISGNTESTATDTSGGVVPTLLALHSDMGIALANIQWQIGHYGDGAHQDMSAINDKLIGVLTVRSENRSGSNWPTFASGGMHLGGARIVGERGPELEVTGPARIYSAAQTQRMLGAGGDNGRMANEMRQLREDVTYLLERQIMVTAEGHKKSIAELSAISAGFERGGKRALQDAMRLPATAGV